MRTRAVIFNCKRFKYWRWDVDLITVCTDLAKNSHFGKKIKSLWLFRKVVFSFWKKLNQLWKMFMLLGKFSFVHTAEYLTIILAVWSQCLLSNNNKTPVQKKGNLSVEWYLNLEIFRELDHFEQKYILYSNVVALFWQIFFDSDQQNNDQTGVAYINRSPNRK